MSKRKTADLTENLLEAIVQGIHEKKGLEIVSLHLASIQSTVCDYFIICHGTSRTHVHAIAESVEESVKKPLGVNAGRREGFDNSKR